MKKKFIFLFFIMVLCNVFAQTIETVKSFKFNEDIPYYETWNLQEGRRSGIGFIGFLNGNMIIKDGSCGKWFNADDFTNSYTSKDIYSSDVNILNENFFLYGEYGNKVCLLLNNNNLSKPDFYIPLKDCTASFSNAFISDNKLFLANSSKECIYFDLLDDGNIVYHNPVQTQNELENGLGEYLGYKN